MYDNANTDVFFSSRTVYLSAQLNHSSQGHSNNNNNNNSNLVLLELQLHLV
jgi:hypothetical protein